MAVLLAGLGLSVAKVAQAKGFIEYLKPAPIACSPLSSATWGVAGVLPRDLCNGIESAKGAAVPPDYYYWDGEIIKAKDGKYHMFMSTWSGHAGFNPGWRSSDAYHAISSQGCWGPTMRQDYVYTNNGSHKGHNVSALELPDGSYAVVVSEIVPFTIYKSTSLDGPWTGCTASIQTNGSRPVHHDLPSWRRLQRHTLRLERQPRGAPRWKVRDRAAPRVHRDREHPVRPYVMQKPTWTYPQANLPNVDSIYPKRTSIPGVTNPTYGWEEDPHIWYSAGTYHVIYSGSRIASATTFIQPTASRTGRTTGTVGLRGITRRSSATREAPPAASGTRWSGPAWSWKTATRPTSPGPWPTSTRTIRSGRFEPR